MTVSVVADGMAFFDHLADQFRIVPDKIADNEKSGGSVVVFQRFQDRRGVSIFIAAVKGQIQFFFFSILGEPGVISFSSSMVAFPVGRFPSSEKPRPQFSLSETGETAVSRAATPRASR